MCREKGSDPNSRQRPEGCFALLGSDPFSLVRGDVPGYACIPKSVLSPATWTLTCGIAAGSNTESPVDMSNV